MSRLQPSPNWGGKREGAGRKAVELRKPKSFRLSDSEHKAVSAFLRDLRQADKDIAKIDKALAASTKFYTTQEARRELGLED